MSLQKKATVVATTIAALLTVLKLTIGIASGSVAVLASAVDSLLDMAISIFNYFAVKISEEKPTPEYQYAKGKIQAIAAVIESTVIISSGIFIIYQAIKKIMDGSSVQMLGSSIVVMLISIVVTYFLVSYLNAIAKKTDSLIIKSDALHYKTDLWSNIVVLISLLLVWLSDFGMIDAILGLGIGVYIIYSAYEIGEQGVGILLDKALEPETIEQINQIIESQDQVNGHHWLKTRTDGSRNFVEFHLVLHPDMRLIEAHDISDEIEEKIAAIDETKVWVITPHYDPYDDEHINNQTFKTPTNAT